MEIVTLLRTPELRFGDFLVPWGMVIGVLGISWRVDRDRGDGTLRMDTRDLASAVVLRRAGGLSRLGYRFDSCSVKISRPHLVTFAMVVLALVATLILYWRYSTKPWTRDGQVRANVVGIAPRVAGPIIQIPIKDNQAVKKGDLLFEIDPSTFRAVGRQRGRKA